jgi:hypothetical protein
MTWGKDSFALAPYLGLCHKERCVLRCPSCLRSIAGCPAQVTNTQTHKRQNPLVRVRQVTHKMRLTLNWQVADDAVAELRHLALHNGYGQPALGDHVAVQDPTAAVIMCREHEHVWVQVLRAAC